MINRILMELYDDYEKNNIESLIEFARKTFPSDGTEKLFIGCTLILFSRCSGYKARYSATREALFSIVLSAKEKVGNASLLAFYLDRVNTKKGINKYLKDIVNDKHINQYANLIIEYLEQFKPDFIAEIKQNKNLDNYLNSIRKEK